MARAAKVCPTPGCPNLQPCPIHHHDRNRPSAAQRGYDHRWRKRAASYLHRHPTCIDCGDPATVPDHSPRTRRELVAAGVADPDADEYLEPRCKPCHDRKTATVDGGFGGVG